MIDTSVPEEFDELGPSRTQARAARREVQDNLDSLTKRLVALPAKKLATLALDPMLHDAVTLLTGMSKGSGLARQRRLVARMLRAEDVDALNRRIDGATGVDADFTYRLERWRERLVDGGDAALSALVDAHPSADRTRLRQAIRAAVVERTEGKTNRRWKELYQLVREVVEAG